MILACPATSSSYFYMLPYLAYLVRGVANVRKVCYSAARQATALQSEKNMILRYVIVFLSCVSVASVSRAADSGPVFRVPRIADVKADAGFTDWQGRGLVIATLVSKGGGPWTKETPPAKVTVGWNQDVMILSFDVQQRKVREHDYIRHLFKGDSVEVFLSVKKGSHDRYMLVASPGLDSKFSKPRHCFFADPAEAAEKDLSFMSVEIASRATSDGYSMELRLPWKNLGIEVFEGLELGLQIYVMETDDNGRCHTAMWHPAGDSHVDAKAVHRVILSDKPSPPVTAIVSLQGTVENQDSSMLRVVGTGDFGGTAFRINTGAGVLFNTLNRVRSQAVAELELSPKTLKSVQIGRQAILPVILGADEQLEKIYTEQLKVGLKQYVVNGKQIPAAEILGVAGFTLTRTRLFNADYQEVDAVTEPGRYGVAIEFKDSTGRLMRRFRTLFVVPPMMGTWRADQDSVVSLLNQMAEDDLSKEIARHNQSSSFDFSRASIGDPDTASFLAYRFEISQSQPPVTIGDYQVVDRQWWVGLKRRLYSWDKQFSGAMKEPQVIRDLAAPVLREGSLSEAGISPDTIKKLEQICDAVTKDSGEPIVICLARHGVIFFHRAYGTTEAGPMTVDTPCDMSSMSKSFAGALMMFAVEQGRVKLDDQVARFFPQFGIKVPKPLTIAPLYTNMAGGLRGDWGDRLHDTEEIIAGYYPVLEVGNYHYNNLGFALGGKILEAVSGEAYPEFAVRHFLAPLGMTRTEVRAAAYGIRSTAKDFAIFGQMLLNRGSYGNLRFYSESTFEQMVPNRERGPRSGIGFMAMESAPLGKGTFGHDSAHSGTFRVAPAYDLVISVTSIGVRKTFNSCYPQLFETIVSGIQDSK